MASKVHLVRHAESVHNVTHDFSQLDPELTPLGLQQATGLGQLFASAPQVGVIITSPLKRAVQTTLTAFPHILDKRYFDPESGHGVETFSWTRIYKREVLFPVIPGPQLRSWKRLSRD